LAAVAPDVILANGALADQITAVNNSLGHEIGPIGALIGATTDKVAAATLSRLPHSLILAPGVGALQAGDDV
jgi:orotidine-5'-phosphate decarboxylase